MKDYSKYIGYELIDVFKELQIGITEMQRLGMVIDPNTYTVIGYKQPKPADPRWKPKKQ